MKTKIFSLILFVISAILSGVLAFLLHENDRLKDSISRQDLLINKKLKDDKFDKKIEKYTDSIKTVTNKISILMNDKEVTGSQIVAILNRMQNQKDSLDNKLWETSELLRFAKENYKFDVYLDKKLNNTTLNLRESQADSAKILLKHFRKRLTKNKDGNWVIDVSGGEETKKELKSITKLLDSTKKQ